MGLLGIGVAAETAVLVAIALTALVLVGLANAISVLGRLLDTLDD